ncbi:MAG TPA: PilZ domain-containing protein [Polyangiaceae bacterium]|nr:PilZ domain-containing protein [Polyangiaceae bacterium]
MQEKRAHSRIQVRIDVSCTTDAGAVVAGVTRDLAVGGAFIESSEMPAFGSKVKLELKLPGGEPLQVSGIVRWTKPGGFGVQFQLLGAKETYALAKLSSGK